MSARTMAACMPECRSVHPPFKMDQGDRVRREYPEAIRLAEARAARRGRQTVRKHHGRFTRSGVWFVQDVRPS